MFDASKALRKAREARGESAPAITAADIARVENKIIAARTALVLDAPFFGALILSLKMVPDPTCPTAWVDGRSIGYNPKFVAGLSHDQTVGLLAHETMHPALGHPWRRGGRAFRQWNIACDKAINTVLQESGFKLPPDAYYSEGDEVGKSAEWIFGKIQQQESQPEPEQDEPEQDEPEQDGDESGEPGDEPGNQPGDSLGEVRDAPDAPDEDGNPAPTEQEWKERVTVAAIQAEAQGKLGAGMKRLVEQSLKPTVDVRSLLLRFFSERCAGDYSWTRPNSRYIAQGLYLPALYSETLGHVAIINDTSRSRGNRQMDAARRIVESVIEECNPATVTIYHADAAVARVDRLEKGDPMVWEAEGGGGTDFRPALEAIEDEGTAVCAVYITDLYGTFPETAPSFPVLWLSTTEDLEAPFGETVYVEG